MLKKLWQMRDRLKSSVNNYALTLGVMLFNGLLAHLLFCITKGPEIILFLALASICAVAVLTANRYCVLLSACVTLLYIILYYSFSGPLRIYPTAHLVVSFVSACIVAAVFIALITGQDRRDYLTGAEENKLFVLTSLTHALLVARGMEAIRELILDSIGDICGAPSILFIRGTDGRIMDCCRSPQGLLYYPRELEAAREAFESAIPVGRMFSCCEGVAFTHLPLIAHGQVLAVAAILVPAEAHIDDQTALRLDMLIKQAASAIERQSLADEQQRILLENQTEHIRSSFLQAVSHDIRSPLTGIMGACSTLHKSGRHMDRITQNQLLQNIYEEAEWLLHMVENLLSITKINNSPLNISKTVEMAEELVGEAALRCQKRFPQMSLHVVASEEPIFVSVDAMLIVQVLINLIENAVRYSGGKQIDIVSASDGAWAVFTVRDYGRGLPPERLETLFLPLMEQGGNHAGGLGIGLSLCRSIIAAHGGEICGSNSPEGGAVLTFTLPLEDNNEH